MKSLIEFSPIEPTYNLSNAPKKLWIGYPGISYDMSKARVVASFQNILAPGFGGNLASVLTNLTNT